jgi:hypothetical protein
MEGGSVRNLMKVLKDRAKSARRDMRELGESVEELKMEMQTMGTNISSQID